VPAAAGPASRYAGRRESKNPPLEGKGSQHQADAGEDQQREQEELCCLPRPAIFVKGIVQDAQNEHAHAFEQDQHDQTVQPLVRVVPSWLHDPAGVASDDERRHDQARNERPPVRSCRDRRHARPSPAAASINPAFRHGERPCPGQLAADDAMNENA